MRSKVPTQSHRHGSLGSIRQDAIQLSEKTAYDGASVWVTYSSHPMTRSVRMVITPDCDIVKSKGW